MSNKRVIVPDRSQPFSFPDSMTVQEIRAALVTTGYTSVETAEAVESADGRTITFRRIQGGSKGR